MSQSSEARNREAILTHSRQAAEFVASYEAFARDPHRDCFAYSRRRLDIALRRFLPARGEGLRLLDIGCGTGHHLATLRAQGFEVAGVDGSATMLEHAQRNNPGVELKLGDVEQVPFEDGSFDLGVCIEVLRYLASPDACLREAGRVLRKGGILLATAAPLLNANGYFLVNRLATLLPMGSLVNLRQFFTTTGRLRKALERAGFCDVRVQGVYAGPINWVERLAPQHLPAVLRRWEPWDAVLCDHPLLRQFSNMFLAFGRKAGP